MIFGPKNFSEGRIWLAIKSQEHELTAAIANYLERCIENGFDGNNAVVGLWAASGLIDGTDTAPIFVVGAGEDAKIKYDGPECLQMNAFYKARASAHTGLDTIVCVQYSEQWLAVQGRYFPWAGAIIRGIGRIEFVVATSGFTQTEDHETSEGVWKLITDFLVREIAEDLRRADLEDDDPERVKYPVGRSPGDPFTLPKVISVKDTPQGRIAVTNSPSVTE